MKVPIFYVQALVLVVTFVAEGSTESPPVIVPEIFVNLAVNKTTWQSSTYDNEYNPVADKAVDGDRSSSWYSQSCTHTNEEYGAWWVVDLGEEYPVTDVLIVNRGDCCGERLSDFSVLVGQTFGPENFDRSSFEQCASVPGQLFDGETRTIGCGRAINGRFVAIVLNGRNYLTLCEVEVYSRSEAFDNLARHKPAWQSTTLTKYEDDYGFIPIAEFGVDDNNSPIFDDGSCTHTWVDPTPWFTVDLLSEYVVTEVVITNRGDCCAERLYDFTVAVGNSFDENNYEENFDPRSFSTCAHVYGPLATSETRNVPCDNEVSGRYVTVYINTKGILTLCELQVYGRNITGTGGSGSPEDK